MGIPLNDLVYMCEIWKEAREEMGPMILWHAIIRVISGKPGTRKFLNSDFRCHYQRNSTEMTALL